MRLLPVGLLVFVPALLAAAPLQAVETAAWEPAAAAGTSSASAPALRTTPDPVTPPPALRTVPVAPPIAAPSAARQYGPQRLGFQDGVAAAFDIPYQTIKGFRPLTLDLYQPRPRDYPLPGIVFVHGGGFGGGDSRHAGTYDDFPAALAALAAQGYVVASVNYRLSGEARFPAALLDIKAAVRWLRARGGIDTTRVAVWGAGSGGQLAALAGVSCGVPALSASEPANDAPSDCVQAVIDWYGPVDPRTAGEAGGFSATQSDAGAFLGCEPAACPPGLAKLASPLSYISATSPAFLIVHGAADTLVPVAQSQALAAALKAKGAPAELVVYPGLGQGLTRDGAPDLAANRQALDKAASFLAATFPPGPIGLKTAARRGPVY